MPEIEGLELITLADVRELIDKRLPAEYRAKFTWRQLAGLLRRVAEGGAGCGRGFDVAADGATARGHQDRTAIESCTSLAKICT